MELACSLMATGMLPTGCRAFPGEVLGQRVLRRLSAQPFSDVPGPEAYTDCDLVVRNYVTGNVAIDRLRADRQQGSHFLSSQEIGPARQAVEDILSGIPRVAGAGFWARVVAPIGPPTETCFRASVERRGMESVVAAVAKLRQRLET